MGGINLKKFSKLFLALLIAGVVTFNFGFADTVKSTETANNESVQSESVETENTEDNKKIDIGVDLENKTKEAVEGAENLAFKIVEQISDKCLPVCAIFALWGAVLYFILGIRNLYKKRQGLLLMWGSFTFVVIAKIVNLIFCLIR